MYRKMLILIVAALLAVPVGVSAWGDDGGGAIQLAQAGRRPFGEAARERRESGKYTDILGRSGNGPQYGEEAPDFSLMPLKFYEFGIDETEITKENAGLLYEPVRLSDFRGKKPVVLIFGSYT